VIAFDLPPLSIEILDGDIADQDVDAVVNAANTMFWMGSGVAGALRKRGGRRIEWQAMKQGPAKPGESVITIGGRLPARHVIHAAVMGQNLVTSAAIIDRATRSALALAEANQLASIAFPAFGTGVGGFPVDECARIMISAVRDTAPSTASLKLVRFVLYGTGAYTVFERVARDTLGTHG
jgi:O-acetyl-ADP-ribose deacetylase (regulator of RNase III)